MPETTADYFSPEAFEQACERSGLTRKRIAEALGVTPTTMSNVTSGRTTPSLKLLTRMVEVFGGQLSDYLAMPEQEAWKLQHYRIARGLTQGGLAQCLGTSQQTVNAWEVGKYSPSDEAFTKLADLYGVTAQKMREVTAATAAAAPADRKMAMETAATLEVAETVLALAEEATELAWRDGVTAKERRAIYTQTRIRTEQALSLVDALIPQLPPARRVAASRLLRKLTEVFEEVSEI